MGSTGFHRFAKILASVLLIGEAFYFAFTQPGPMDTVRGGILGFILYAIWLAEEKKNETGSLRN